MAQSDDDVTRYRNRADELRAIAESLTDAENRKLLEDWAADYDRKVRRIEAKEPD